jgi:hypothetical protein
MISPKLIIMSLTGKYQLCSSNLLLYYSSDFGDSWNTKNHTAEYYCIITMSPSGTYCLSWNFTNVASPIYYSQNYGVDWAIINNPILSYDSWPTFKITDDRQVIISDHNKNKIYNGNISNAGVLTVTTANMYINSVAVINGIDFDCVAMSSTGKYRVCGTRYGNTFTTRGIYYSSDSGATFDRSDAPSDCDWGGNLEQYSDNRGIIMSSDGQYVVAIHADTTTTTYKSLKVYVSTTYGKTWTLNAKVTTGINILDFCISSTGQYQIYANGTSYLFSSVGNTI